VHDGPLILPNGSVITFDDIKPEPSPGGFQLNPRQRLANAMLAGPQRHSLLVGGARSGKTFLFIRAIVTRALRAPMSRHAVLRFRGNAVRSTIALDTLPKVMRLCFPGTPYRQHSQDGYFEFPSVGSEIWYGGLDEKERVDKILGMEFVTILYNECSQIPFASVIVADTRLAQVVLDVRGRPLKQRAYYDLNPTNTGHWSNQIFHELRDPVTRVPFDEGRRADYQAMQINPDDNAANLTPEFLESLRRLPARARKRFFEGVYTPDVEGALWTYEIIDRNRVKPGDVPALDEITIAVDPSGAGEKQDGDIDRHNEIGIIATGRAANGHGYVLGDYSVLDSPAKWGRAAVNAYRLHDADYILGEKNYGGAMVKFVIRAADRDVPFREVTATRGKAIRAAPVSTLYENGKVHHAGYFPELEDQLIGFTDSGYTGESSPDRADALVWGLTKLMVAAKEWDGTGIAIAGEDPTTPSRDESERFERPVRVSPRKRESWERR
jgi:phage terminase large subunit-like protein